MGKILWTVIALSIGILMSFAIHYVSVALLKKVGERILSLVSVVRQVINVSYLVAVYLIFKDASFSVMYVLVGAALGVTVPTVALSFSLAKKISDVKNGDIDDKDKNDDIKR